MPLSQVSSILTKILTLNQAKQIHAQLFVNNLLTLQPELIFRLLSSHNNFSPSLIYYVKTILWYLEHPDPFCWSSTIRSFSQHGQFKEAFSLHVQMQRSGIQPTTFTISSSLRSCARIPYKIGGISIHTQVHKYEFLQCVYVKTALLDFYSKLGDMKCAEKVFNEMGDKNVVSWNSLLAGYLKSNDFLIAKQLFDEMPCKDIVSWNSILSGYARLGDMNNAHLSFEKMPVKNVASWNAMISGYVECGKIDLARGFFDAMPHRNNISWITMISGYSKCGDVEAAHNIFSKMPKKDVFSYNSMIACYTQNSRPKDAIDLFKEMLKKNIINQPDKMTLASVISACSQLGDFDYGTYIETYMKRQGIEVDDHLATALLDLHGKCGSINKASELFHGLLRKDVVSYTAMIVGYGINGKPKDAMKLFEEMLEAKISPNLVTFTGILTAYNHAGLVEEGYQCFESMKKFGLMPNIDHYGIMVDLLGRAGRLDEAYDLIKTMPIPAHSGVWGALLLACRLHNNVELAEVAAKNCFYLENDKAGYSSLLGNIYALNERWDDVKRLKKDLNFEGRVRVPGCSWV